MAHKSSIIVKKLTLFLIFLNLLFTSETAAQTTCKNGLGRVLYERLPNQQLQGYDDDVVRDTAPPFRVLEKCQDLCLRDRTGTNNLVRTCTSFDFQPGSRIASFSGNAEYEETICYLTSEQAGPEGIGSLMLVPNSVHFNEICLTSNRPERECPSRRYIFERHPRKKLKLPISDIKEITAANRSDCEDKCLNEFSFVCRSANFDSTMRTCSLSRFTRRTHPELLEDDPNSDYLENTCLNAERRCDGLAVFVKEENKRLGGPFEVDIFNNMTLEECQTMCLRAEKYFCRSVEFDDQTKQCILSEEDSISQKDDISISSSLTHHFYDLVCLDNQRATDYPDNSVTSHLYSNSRRPDTAFQRYRNSRLGGEFHSEITGRSLSECLDECLRQTSFQCRSAVYSDRFRTCRLSRYNQKDGMRIIYDADYDYYENLMLNVVNGSEGDHEGNNRPDNNDGNWRQPTLYPTGERDKYPIGNDRPPSHGSRDRYPNRDGQYDKYPMDRPFYDHFGMDGFPGGRPVDRDRDRFPIRDGHYPVNRYPMNYIPNDYDRLPNEKYPKDRYRPEDDKYYNDRDRYQPNGKDRFHPGNDLDRDRYPPIRDNALGERHPIDDRFPLMDKYPNRDRFPENERYPGGDKYHHKEKERYPPMRHDFNRYNYDRDIYSENGKRYPISMRPGDRGPYPYYDYLNQMHPSGPRYHYEYGRPAIGRYPMREGYPGRDSSPGNDQIFPDKRFRPSSFINRYPFGDITHNARRPEPEGSKRYPPGINSRYPIQNSRFPIGNRYSGRPGQDRPPQSFYDYEYDDRSNDRPFIPPYDREFDEEFGRRPPGRYPPFESPYSRPLSGNSISQLPPETVGIVGSRPQGGGGIRCDEGDNFKQIAARHKMRRQFIRRSLTASSLIQCERECIENKDFICRSFNYRDSAASTFDDRNVPNCELSDRDTRELDVHNPSLFDSGNYDFYERSMGRSDGECLDVSQTCNEDGMEFTLRTPEGFIGRIYSYGFYDRCFFRGNGGTVNVLRISGPQGYPECGTQRFGDTLTNIIVAQFSDNVQTSRDKRYNLTCVFRGPGEAVVTSGYIGAGSGSPIPIEYLPAENTLSSKVRLMILYQGRPTTTIAVGDPLTFRLETQDGYNHITDIFATNVVARDPYSGRSIQLIDRFGCPVDPFVFPELDRLRSGDTLEARFNAFKIPESNFLVFEATVRSCRDGCQPAYCPGQSGRSEPSFGRRRRSINETSNNVLPMNENNTSSNITALLINKAANISIEESQPEEPEQVREMIEVFESRDEITKEVLPRKLISALETTCLSSTEYYVLIAGIIILMILLFSCSIIAGLAYRWYRRMMSKTHSIDRISPITSFTPSSMRNHEPFKEVGTASLPSSRNFRPNISLFGNGIQKTFATGNLARMCNLPSMNPLKSIPSEFEDPSEPIYTDPSLFERSRSLRSVSIEDRAQE
ncbi:hypothetical protein ACFFRR_009869 [Megaselia abdita]